MSISTIDNALLAQDSYEKREKDGKVLIGGHYYKVLDVANNGVTGYQGVAYMRLDAQNKPTGEVVIAHRGTEGKVNDIATDAGMVLTGVNAQTLDAEAFTKRVMEQTKALSAKEGKPFDVTVTGHSLGGALAELTAYKFNLRGETFNGYGAAGLWQGVPQGGSQVINHVRATDIVSAASQHFGEVRVYATAQDIDTLTKAHYKPDGGGFWRNIVQGKDFGAHGIANFVPDAQGHCAMDPENTARYRANQPMVDRYRQDVLQTRTIVSMGWEAPKAAAETGEALGRAAGQRLAETYQAARAAAEPVMRRAVEAIENGTKQAGQGIGQAYDATRDAVKSGAQAIEKKAQEAGRAISEGASRAYDRLTNPGSWFGSDAQSKPAAQPVKLLDDPSHLGHPLFKQAQSSMYKFDTERGRTPNAQTDNASACLAVSAFKDGMQRIDSVALSADASKLFAVQGPLNSPLKQITSVPTTEALNTSIAQSSLQWQQHAATQAQSNAQTPQPHTQAQPRPSV